MCIRDSEYPDVGEFEESKQNYRQKIAEQYLKIAKYLDLPDDIPEISQMIGVKGGKIMKCPYGFVYDYKEGDCISLS